ncbi:efflux RND transporter periplasmic adaptor subunit [Azohydromonas australica]|uniref:efflux RND transporter periplasmic adaptor subunit n=1 Tax=Azohydromonas australica TaxID=364039 RepID=UPI0005B7FE47|nr:efflux RND transporter periplasmic adaptor subunit [Azohydromonas australica]
MQHPMRAGVWARLAAGLGLAWMAATSQQALAAEYVGIVYPRHDLTLSVPVPGIVSRVLVEPGKRVEARQALLALDDRMQATEEQRRKVVLEDQSEMQATQERLRIVEPLHEDMRKLQGTRGAVSREEAARVELDVVTARSRLAQLQAQKKRERIELQGAEQERQLRQLLAPVGGVVTRIDIEIGEWAKPGDAVVQLVDASVCQLRANVPAAVARGLRTGTTLPVRFEPALGLPEVKGELTFVSPAVDPASGLVELRVRFANADARVPSGVKGYLQVPGAAR